MVCEYSDRDVDAFFPDPQEKEPEVIMYDYFDDEVFEGDEYWEINGDIVLDENVREYIAKEFELKVAEKEDDEWRRYEFCDEI